MHKNTMDLFLIILMPTDWSDMPSIHEKLRTGGKKSQCFDAQKECCHLIRNQQKSGQKSDNYIIIYNLFKFLFTKESFFIVKKCHFPF